MFLKCIDILIKLNFKPKFLIKGELRYIKASNILILFKKNVYLRTKYFKNIFFFIYASSNVFTLIYRLKNYLYAFIKANKRN